MDAIIATGSMIEPIDRAVADRRPWRRLVTGIALLWAGLHIWFASPLGFLFAELSLNDAEARSVHLACALLLAGLLGSGPHGGGPRWLRLALGLGGAVAAGYIVAFYSELAARPGQPTGVELALSALGLGLLLIAAWRTVGRTLALVGALALAAASWHGGALLEGMAEQWLSPRGVFGAPLGLSAQFLFLATVLAMLLVAWGAVARWAALLARLGREGTAGTPLASFGGRLLAGIATPGVQAAADAGNAALGASSSRTATALALAAAVLSQAVPPLLGYAVAVLPGALRIGAGSVLGAVATLGALALGGALLTLGLGATAPRVRLARLAGWCAGGALIVLSAAGLLGGYLQAKAAYGGVVSWLAGGATALLYAALHWSELRLAHDGLARLAVGALRTALPLLVLVWGLLVEGLDSGLVVFWTIGFTLFVIVIGALLEARWGVRDRPLAALRGAGRTIAHGIVHGVEHATRLAIAAAVAGLLIAAAQAVGASAVLTRALEWTLPAGALGAVLALGALAAGCGALLPTVPAYLVIAAVLVPVLLDLGVRGGAAMPLLAAHLCLLQGAIVGAALGLGVRGVAWRLIAPLAALALALPFNGALLGSLDTVERWWALAGATLGTVLLARLLAPAWRRALPRAEALAMMVAIASLLAPRLWLDAWSPATAPVDARRLVAIAGALPPDAGIAVIVANGLGGPAGRPRAMTLPLGAPGGGAERLASAGIELRQEGELVKLARVGPASWADRNGLRRGETVLMVRAPVAQPPLGVVLVPAAALALFVLRRRARRLRESNEDH